MKQELIEELKERLEKTHKAIELNQTASIDKEDELEEQKVKFSLIELEISQEIAKTTITTNGKTKSLFSNADSQKAETKRILENNKNCIELVEAIRKGNRGRKTDDICLSSLKRRHKMDLLFLQMEVQ